MSDSDVLSLSSPPSKPRLKSADGPNIRVVHAGGYGGSALGFPLHRHELAWELIYVVEGNLTQRVETESFDLQRGEFILHPPGVLHGDLASDDYFLYHLIFTTKQSINLPIRGADLDGAPMRAILEIIVREWYSGWAQRDLMIRLMTQSLEVLLRRVQCQVVKSQSAMKIVSQARTIFRQHFREQLSMDDIARQLGVGRSAFYQAFQTVLGKSPQHVVDEYRIQHAIFLLKHSELPVAEIALSCGYCTSSHLSRKLKATTHLSPLELRHVAFEQEPSN